MRKWHRVIFSDEKKWNLQGNDKFVNVWTEDLNTYTIAKGEALTGSLMVWGAISVEGTLRLICTPGKINANVYIEMLENDFFSHPKTDLPDNFIFQQDNVPSHSTQKIMEYFASNNINVMKWPAKSPDLSPIENVWSYMSDQIYHDGTTYQNVNYLWDALVKAWQSIPIEYIESLYTSIPK